MYIFQILYSISSFLRTLFHTQATNQILSFLALSVISIFLYETGHIQRPRGDIFSYTVLRRDIQFVTKKKLL